MPKRFRLVAMAAAASLLILSGCGTINEKASVGLGDYIPQWAGGLPSDTPPRPGTVQYDVWMKERERQRQMPAADREATKSDQSKLDLVR